MTELRVDLPSALAAELTGPIGRGWFTSEEEITRLALVELVRRHRFRLEEQFQREDIAWALSQRGPASPAGERA